MTWTRVAWLALALPLFAQTNNPFLGRWDLTLKTATETYPNWVEVTADNAATVQLRTGSILPAKDVKIVGATLTLTAYQGITWQLTVAGDRLTGTEQRAGVEHAKIAGVRAPALNRPEPKAWSKPTPLFDGKDLNGWEPDDKSKNHWAAHDGELVNESHGANLRTVPKFQDFKLHLEFNCPDDGNSGLYLRGRYEVQIEYEPVGRNDPAHSMGSLYGRIAPSQVLPKKPGQWESYDVTLVGRTLTVVRNGVTVIDHKEIAGITGGALDSDEGAPGPFYLQGDHTGGLKFRNILVSTPLSR
jgi:Domain of Unknown Function (DUF1080)